MCRPGLNRRRGDWRRPALLVGWVTARLMSGSKVRVCGTTLGLPGVWGRRNLSWCGRGGRNDGRLSGILRRSLVSPSAIMPGWVRLIGDGVPRLASVRLMLTVFVAAAVARLNRIAIGLVVRWLAWVPVMIVVVAIGVRAKMIPIPAGWMPGTGGLVGAS